MACSSVVIERRSPLADPLTRLPLATLYLTERCNSRCVSCDYWRHGRRDIDLAAVQRLLPDLAALGTQIVLVSGGEPLLHPQWSEIAALLRARGLKLWLLTAGLALAKHAAEVARRFDQLTVSLDGSTAASYAAIRGLDAFEAVCAGIRAAAREGVPVGLRVPISPRCWVWRSSNHSTWPRRLFNSRCGSLPHDRLAAAQSQARKPRHVGRRTPAVTHPSAPRRAAPARRPPTFARPASWQQTDRRCRSCPWAES
ncbi:MAG: radical SAM protein [Roseateles sp.]|uniref:radical SAM protein n=1 Tax=Roseateles sp. TaxID=1971397 RepID=UPI004035DC92